MKSVLLLFPALLLGQALPTVSIRNDGVWLESSGRAALRISENNLCNAIDLVEWIDQSRLAVECHINPSLSEYFEIDVPTGRIAKDLLGYWFQRSPRGDKVAHAGSIPHFAPAYAKSNELQFDGKTVYPTEPRAVPFLGIHEFVFGYRWSPDGAHFAFVERVYDWSPDGEDVNNGKESNSEYFLVVVSENDPLIRMPIPDPAGAFLLVWEDAATVDYTAANLRSSLHVGPLP